MSTVARQKENLREWAGRLGLLLDPEVIISRLVRGGQEHDIFQVGERVFKVTRNGIFGFPPPGIELALVSSGEDARRKQRSARASHVKCQAGNPPSM